MENLVKPAPVADNRARPAEAASIAAFARYLAIAALLAAFTGSTRAQYSLGVNVGDLFTHYVVDTTAHLLIDYYAVSDGYAKGVNVGDRYAYVVTDTTAARLVFEAGSPPTSALPSGWSYSKGVNVGDRYTHAVTDTTAAQLVMVLDGGGGGGGATYTYDIRVDTFAFADVSAIRTTTEFDTLSSGERYELQIYRIVGSGGADFDVATTNDSANVAFVAGASDTGVGVTRVPFEAIDEAELFVTKHSATTGGDIVATRIVRDVDDDDAFSATATAFDSTYSVLLEDMDTAATTIATFPAYADVEEIVAVIDTAATDTAIVEVGGREVARFSTETETTTTVVTPTFATDATESITVRLTSVAAAGYFRVRIRGVVYAE
jgi:hypothetical protein